MVAEYCSNDCSHSNSQLDGLDRLLRGAWLGDQRESFSRACKTTPDPRKKPTTLVTSGSFGINRNPIYSGMTVMLIGWGAVLGSLMALFLLAVGSFIVINARFTGPEEVALREAFGNAGEEYIQKTRRW